MKKPFQETIVGRIALTLLSILIKKAPFIKTNQDKKNVDDVFGSIK
jgi:hypothetical protein